jgi:iturin family lipopeptide synthetase A
VPGDVAFEFLLWSRAKFQLPSDSDKFLAVDFSIIYARPNPWGRALQLSISFFGSYPAVATRQAYQLMFAASEEADRKGFVGVWLPERHFDEFGSLSPNPALLAAAMSRSTSRVRLRAGSVVLPLHHPIRVAEEWAVVDQLSGGRVEVAFASGWHAHDFVIRPETYARRKEVMWQSAAQVRALWRGEGIELPGGDGLPAEVKTFPRPVQPDLPMWFAALGDPGTFVQAGRFGAGVLTNLIQQNVEELAEKIILYRRERAEAGHDPAGGRIAVLMHSFVLDDDEAAREVARAPLKRYLQSSVQLAGRTKKGGLGKALEQLPERDREYLFDRGVQRYIDSQSLIGSPETVCGRLEALSKAGIDEVACFVDFGLAPADIMKSLGTIASRVIGTCC